MGPQLLYLATSCTECISTARTSCKCADVSGPAESVMQYMASAGQLTYPQALRKQLHKLGEAGSRGLPNPKGHFQVRFKAHHSSL